MAAQIFGLDIGRSFISAGRLGILRSCQWRSSDV